MSEGGRRVGGQSAGGGGAEWGSVGEALTVGGAVGAVGAEGV